MAEPNKMAARPISIAAALLGMKSATAAGVGGWVGGRGGGVQQAEH